jgi:CheY-like chemotaxis protein
MANVTRFTPYTSNIGFMMMMSITHFLHLVTKGSQARMPFFVRIPHRIMKLTRFNNLIKILVLHNKKFGIIVRDALAWYRACGCQSRTMDTESHILLVDDEPAICDAVSDYLAGEGYRVSVAHDGKAMRQIIRLSPVDLVLLDVVLPGEDGLTLARALRAEKLDIGIIMLTGRADTIDRIIGLESGADDYLPNRFTCANCWRGSGAWAAAPRVPNCRLPTAPRCVSPAGGSTLRRANSLHPKGSGCG